MREAEEVETAEAKKPAEITATPAATEVSYLTDEEILSEVKRRKKSS